MAIAQPAASDPLNTSGEDHATLHRIIAADPSATAESLTVNSSSVVTLLNPLPLTSGGTGTTTGPFSTQNVVTGSRGIETGDGTHIYHNTTGKTMFVVVGGYSVATGTIQAETDSSSSPLTVVAYSGSTGTSNSLAFMVLSGNYYEVSIFNGSFTINSWTEWY